MDNQPRTKWERFKSSLGPGLLMSAAAIGVSHLVQSTRAGATYGFALIWAVILANFFKYPFLEYGSRYANATGESMVEGYQRLGSGALGIFVVFTVGTMFAVQAAVTMVSANLAAELTGISFSPFIWGAILLVICIAILLSGEYGTLDRVVKIIMSVLALSTIVALAAALLQVPAHSVPAERAPSVWNISGIAFLIALMGWMPIPIDIAVWQSLWSLERQKQTNYKPQMNEWRLDFNIGYIGAALLALGFLTLGALVMYGSGESFAASGTAFAEQLIRLYTNGLGDWAYPIIIICAFTTMFSTTLTVTDAYPRVITRMLELKLSALVRPEQSRRVYRGLLVLISALSMGVLYFLGTSFTLMIDLATTLSFLTAPVLAYINFRLVNADHVPPEYRPGPWMRLLSWSGLLFLSAFGLLYLYWQYAYILF